MKYPERPVEGQWYFEIVADTGTAHYGTTVFNQISVQISVNGEAGTCDFRKIDLTSDTVETELTDAIDVAKKIVKILNGGKNGAIVPETGTCAKCNGPCPEDDYLCHGCRGST